MRTVRASDLAFPVRSIRKNGKNQYVSTNLPKLIGFPIADYIGKHFQKPVFMDNDVKVAALGEAVLGGGAKAFRSYICHNFHRNRRRSCH